MTGYKEFFAQCKFFLDSVKAAILQGYILGPLLFLHILMTLLKTLTPLLDCLLMILACISLSMAPFRLLISKIWTWLKYIAGQIND